MENQEIKITYKSYENAQELSSEDIELLDKAKEALELSYSPYSRFKVGAALKLSSGEIIKGSNQENASFPAGICAERVAIYNAKHQSNSRIESLAITVKSSDFEVNSPIAPCGVCRQVLLETEILQEKDIKILLQGSKGKVYTLSSVKDLLPLFFFEKSLKKEWFLFTYSVVKLIYL